MATTDPFPAEAAIAAAAQLAAFFPASSDGAAAAASGARELTESLAVCVIEARHVTRPPRDLTALARPTGMWHHQVRTAGTATHVAQSGLFGLDGGVEVQQLAETPLAGRIDAALAWADRRVRGRATVRLLIVPAYYVHALLVVRGTEVSAVLVDQPSGFTRLDYEREYPLAEFLKLLAKEKPGSTLTE